MGGTFIKLYNRSQQCLTLITINEILRCCSFCHKRFNTGGAFPSVGEEKRGAGLVPTGVFERVLFVLLGRR